MIQISSDGSASWIIRQTGTNITASFETLVEFRNKVTSLVEAAKNETGRGMVVYEDSMSITSTVSGSYVTIEYRFFWENFSEIESASIAIGDVFQVHDFFLQLYGDGEVYMKYPAGYVVERVSPMPRERDDSLLTLGWPGTEDFNKEGANIVLKEKSAPSGLLEVLGQNAILIVGLVVLVSGVSVGFYIFRRGKKKEGKTVEKLGFPSPLGVESDEEKTLKLLKSSGGSIYQSTITEQCGFSRAKTSQLLAVLEEKGLVRRYKKGRDKVVVLVE